MPPKRKAPNDADDAAESITSPTPRKKTKAEAKAAAREWAENRRKKSAIAASASTSTVSLGSSSVQKAPHRHSTADHTIAANSGASSPTPRKISKAEALASAKAWHENRNRHTTGSSLSVSSTPPITNGSLESDQDKRATGGNAFLKSVRTKVNTPVVTKKEDPPSAVLPESIKPASSTTSNVDSSCTPSPSVVTPSRPKSTLKSCIGNILRFLLFSLGLALNVAAIVGIVQHQLSSFDEFERQNELDVSRLSMAVSKSSELEAVLRSGVRVLEEKVQRMREIVRIGNEGGDHDLHEKQMEEDEDDDLLMRKEKQNLLDALDTLEEQLRDEQL